MPEEARLVDQRLREEVLALFRTFRPSVSSTSTANGATGDLKPDKPASGATPSSSGEVGAIRGFGFESMSRTWRYSKKQRPSSAPCATLKTKFRNGRYFFKAYFRTGRYFLNANFRTWRYFLKTKFRTERNFYLRPRSVPGATS